MNQIIKEIKMLSRYKTTNIMLFSIFGLVNNVKKGEMK